MMTDVFGQELNVGDSVAFMEPGYAYEQKIGVIERVTAKKVVLIWSNSGTLTQTYKFPEQVVKGYPAPGKNFQRVLELTRRVFNERD